MIITCMHTLLLYTHEHKGTSITVYSYISIHKHTRTHAHSCRLQSDYDECSLCYSSATNTSPLLFSYHSPLPRPRARTRRPTRPTFRHLRCRAVGGFYHLPRFVVSVTFFQRHRCSTRSLLLLHLLRSCCWS